MRQTTRDTCARAARRPSRLSLGNNASLSDAITVNAPWTGCLTIGALHLFRLSGADDRVLTPFGGRKLASKHLGPNPEVFAMMTDPSFSEALASAVAGLPEPIPADVRERMAVHWSFVSDWNRKINLTAISDPTTAAWLHYRDALEALPWVREGLTLDVGSGGGFPGIPLALMRPACPFLLMEPRQKRAALLSQAASHLHLAAVGVYHGRLADTPTARCDQVVTRATFSSLSDMAPAAAWLRPGGRLIAYRSASSGLPDEELAVLAAAGLVYETGHPYTLLDRDRRLDVWILRREVSDNRGQ